MEQRCAMMCQMTLATAALVIAHCHRSVILGGIRPAVGKMTVDHHPHIAALVGTRRARPGPCPHCSPLPPAPSQRCTAPPHLLPPNPKMSTIIAHRAKMPPHDVVLDAITKLALQREHLLMRKPCISRLRIIVKVDMRRIAWRRPCDA
jgi:hypothetical protein